MHIGCMLCFFYDFIHNNIKLMKCKHLDCLKWLQLDRITSVKSIFAYYFLLFCNISCLVRTCNNTVSSNQSILFWHCFSVRWALPEQLLWAIKAPKLRLFFSSELVQWDYSNIQNKLVRLPKCTFHCGGTIYPNFGKIVLVKK